MATKVAIVGGGPAGLSAAWHIVQHAPGTEVVVFTPGWRLGGKGATGRSLQAPHRLTEHGIHGFCGFYHQTFQMMREVHDLLGRDSDGVPAPPDGLGARTAATMQNAFIGSSDAVDFAELGPAGRIVARPVVLPHNDAFGPPWAPAKGWDLTPQQVIRGLVDALRFRDGEPVVDGADSRQGKGLPDRPVVMAPLTNRAAAPKGAPMLAPLRQAVSSRFGLEKAPRWLRRLILGFLTVTGPNRTMARQTDLYRHGVPIERGVRDSPKTFSLDRLQLLVDLADILITPGRPSRLRRALVMPLRPFRSWRRIDQVVAWLVDRDDLDRHPELRQSFISIDHLGALMKGVLDAGLLDDHRTVDWERLDALDYSDWLRRHGCTDYSLDSGRVRSIPNLLFAATKGEVGAERSLSAAAYVGWVLRALIPAGQQYYFFKHGTGESVILPVYDALKARGVRFEFFHRLTDLQLSDGAVSGLTFEVQAHPTESEYDPIVRIGRGAQRVWPDQPVWERMAAPGSLQDAVAAGMFDLERDLGGGRALGFEQRRVPVGTGPGHDFECVVLAIPPSAWPDACPQLLDVAEWRQAYDRLSTTSTQAIQVWLRRPARELLPAEAAGTGRFATALLPDPFGGVVDFDDVLESEGWDDGDRPRGLLYLCGQYPSAGPTGAESQEVVRQDARDYLEQILWRYLPGLADNDGASGGDGVRFKWDELFIPAGEGRAADDGFAGQYCRANAAPGERYVQSPPGSRSARMLPWETGVANLAAAGDWVETGIDAGCFEGAVVGGALAAYAVVQGPDPHTIKNWAMFRRPPAAGSRGDAR